MGTPANDVNASEAHNDEWLGDLPDPDGLSNLANDASGPRLDENLDGKSADELRASIEHTRSEMTHTIDAIQDRLNPENIKAQAAAKIHDATMGTVGRAAQTVVNTVAAMTPQPRHANSQYPYGKGTTDWQDSLGRTKLWLKQNPKLLGYMAAGGLLLLGLMVRRRRSAAYERYWGND